MKALKSNNPDGELLTYEQVAEQSNLGLTTVTRLARESGALVKIGKVARVDRQVFFDYIREKYREG